MRILLEGLHIKHYVQDRLPLNMNRLEIHQNNHVGLVGKSGSGKATLLHTSYKKIVSGGGIVKQFSHCELIPQLKLIEPTKSGGEVTRNHIRQALDKNPELLLVDESTTDLNNNHIEKLEQDLKNWHGALIIVLHDRASLDNLYTTIWEIDEGRIAEYEGGYNSYAEQKELERHREELKYEEYGREKKRLEKATNTKEQKT